MMRNVLILVAVAAVLLGYQLYAYKPEVSERALQPKNEQVVSQGQALYMAHCASCHGDNLEGQKNWRQRLASGRLPAPPHDETGHTWHHDDEALFNVTQYGPQYVAGADYQSDMPSFEGVISDAEIVAVLSFIKSTWPAKAQATHDEINRRLEITRQEQN